MGFPSNGFFDVGPMGSGMCWFLLNCQELGKCSWSAGGKSWIGWGGPASK